MDAATAWLLTQVKTCQLAYVTGSNDVSVSSNSESVPTVFISSFSCECDGGPVIATFSCAAIPSVVTGTLVIALYETSMAEIGRFCVTTTAQGGGLFSFPEFTPSAGTHNYEVGACVVSSGSASIGDSVTDCYVRICRVT